MATIYDADGYILTAWLQGSEVCDEAIQAAQRIADHRGEPVKLHDDDGRWLVYPAGTRGVRPPPKFLGDSDIDDEEVAP